MRLACSLQILRSRVVKAVLANSLLLAVGATAAFLVAVTAVLGTLDLQHSKRAEEEEQSQSAATPVPSKLPGSTARANSSTDTLIAAAQEPAAQHNLCLTAECAELQASHQPAASITPRMLPAASLPPKSEDPLAAIFQDLEGQAALLGMQCSPAQAPQTPDRTAGHPASCSSASSSWLGSHDTITSQQSNYSFASEEAQQKAWYLPASVRVDAGDLQHPASGPCLLGRGGMGCVSLMHDTLCAQMVAVKEPVLGEGSRRDCVMACVEKEHALNELLSGTEGLVQYLGPLEQDGELTGSLAFECMAGGSLASNMPALALAPAAVKAGILLDVCRAMANLHQQDVVHADLKPDNILLDRRICTQDTTWTGTAKLGDLGLSREADPDTGLLLHQFEGLCGTLPYMAPEIFQAQAAGKTIDVYAFGVLLWELHHMAVPHAGVGTDELIGHMLMGGGLPRCLPDIDPATFMIMLACTRAQPAARPSFAVLQQAVQLLLVDQPHSSSLHVAQACMRLGL